MRLDTVLDGRPWLDQPPIVRTPADVPAELSRPRFAPAVPRVSAVQVGTLAGDLVILIASYAAVAVAFDLYNGDPARLLLWSSALAAVWLPIAVNQGAYRLTVLANALQSPYVVAKVTLVAGALFHLLPLVGGPVNSRVTSFGVVFVLVVGAAGWRLVVASFLPRVAAPTLMVVVGANWAGLTLAEAVRRCASSAPRIVGFVDADPTLVGTRVHDTLVHPVESLADLVYTPEGTARVVLANADQADAGLYDQLTALAQAGVEVVSMASVYESLTGRIPVRHLGNLWWAALPRPSSDLLYLAAKRTVDVCGALVGLLVLGLLLPFVAVLLKRESHGSLFFVQARMGRFGKPFRVVKLRTLPPTPERVDYWARKNGNQPAPVGAFLRATGIDELPQCWNVLKGEMSLVGPRPYVPDEVADYQLQIPFFRSRALVKPGITGWAQVNWGYGYSLSDEVEKLQYDLYYVGHQSFYLDLSIVLRTLGLLLRRRRSTPRAPQPPVDPLFGLVEPGRRPIGRPRTPSL